MTRWLLTAEADKIQDFVFRSSRLVQVAGGSALLARFCEEAPRALIKHYLGRLPQGDDVIIAAGGSFRLTFESRAVAVAVGRDLSEAYYRIAQGSLTVAEPQPYEEAADEKPTFETASKNAESDLRKQKADRHDLRTAVAHLPYMAFCASCGIALASEYGLRHADDTPNYLCRSCDYKAKERDMIWRAPDQERFLSHFLAALGQTARDRDLLPRDADAVGNLDPRRYVAYLVADGNSMGVLFSKCRDAGALRQLSHELTKTLWSALASATNELVRQLGRHEGCPPIPVLPLIVGGDDLFVLLPAPYALDFARQVCLRVETQLRFVADGLGLLGDGAPRPTMTAAVVICKQNYPYMLAHRQGEALLGEAKRIARTARLSHAVEASLETFTVVRGGDTVGDDAAEEERKFRPSSTPYWIGLPAPTDANLRYGIDLGHLLAARWLLRGLPGKRRAELRELFAGEMPEADRNDPIGKSATNVYDRDWRPKLDALLDRLARHPQQLVNVCKVLALLGDERSGAAPWRRYAERSGEPYCHGLPDLFAAWDFSQDFSHSLDDYEEAGR